MRYYYDLRFFLALSLICCLSQLMSGQQSHFVKIYTDSIPLIGSHITETPGGFEIRQEPAFFSTSYYFQQLNVDAAGDSLTAQVTGFAADSIFDPVFALPDGSFARSAKNSHRLQRLAADGSLMWDTTYVIPDYPIIANSIWNPVKMIAMAGNGDLLVGFRADTAGDYCVMRINPSQEIVWVNKIWNFGPSSGNISIDDRFYHFAPSPDGAVYLTLNTSTGAIFTIFKISTAGQIEWTKHFQLTPPMIKAADDGGLWASTIETDGDFRLTRYGPDGSVLFNKTTNEIVILPPPYNGSVNALLEMPDSTIVVAGHSHDNMDVFFMRMDLQGNIRWFWKGVLFANTPMRIRDGIATADGGFAWTGEFAGYRTLLIKTDSIGRPVTNNVSGHIRWDQNLDCIADVLENPLANWIVQLKKQSAVVTYAYTDTAGHYELPLTDFGNYTVTAIPPSFIWDVCVDEYTFSVPQNTDNLSVVQDFSAQNGYDCPIMSVDFSMPFMRRCFNSPVSLLCRNDGVTDAVDAMLEVILPPHLLLQSASLPYTLSGDTLRIHFNTFEALSYQYISLVVVPDCDSTELGQSLCISAHILPDSICAPIPGWSGALISVSAACEQDSVHFQIHNVGTAQSQTLDYIVIDDHVMSLMDNFTLAAGDTKHVSVAATGGTLRLQADQEPNAPGPTMPSVAVEGCGVDSLGNSSTGFVVQWPNQNGAPATATKCYEIVGSFDPNDKNAIPQGVTDEHFIAPNTPIDYTIRFQNTGTDTAFTVVIKDVIIPWLDIRSIRPGASSHPYTVSFEGAYTVVFTFSNILLPDSSTNFEGSVGFVQFQIDQKPNIENYTIPNQASIFFDYNSPVLTNTTFHKVKTVIIPPLVVAAKTPGNAALPQLEIWPNPAQGSVWIKSPFPNGYVVITDALGREVSRRELRGNVANVERGTLSSGVYWVYWIGDAGLSRMEKLIWQ